MGSSHEERERDVEMVSIMGRKQITRIPQYPGGGGQPCLRKRGFSGGDSGWCFREECREPGIWVLTKGCAGFWASGNRGRKTDRRHLCRPQPCWVIWGFWKDGKRYAIPALKSGLAGRAGSETEKWRWTETSPPAGAWAPPSRLPRALIEQLESKEKAEEIKKSIIYGHFS